MKKNKLIFVCCLPLLLIILVSCAAIPEKRISYNVKDYRELAMKRVTKDKFMLNVSYVSQTESGQVVDSFFHDVYTPPFNLVDDVINDVKQCIDYSEVPEKRFEKLRDCLVNGDNPIVYTPQFTLDATSCFRKKRGNCFALTNLMVGAARLAGLDSRYILVEDIISNNEQGDAIIHTNHIVCGVNVGSKELIADFIPNPKKYRMQTVISDLEAAGLFYNNIASKFMINGDLVNAGVIFEIAYAFFPNSYQINNNVGVLFMKLKQPEKARVYFYRALETTRFPDLIYGNLLSMLKQTGREDEFNGIEDNLKSIKKRNPYFYITLARKAFEGGDYEKSLRYLKIARKLNKSIPQIYTLRSQVYNAMNEFDKKQNDLQKMGEYLRMREY